VILARVRVAAEDGRANQALRALLAAKLDAPVSRVRVAAAAKSRLKHIAVTGDPNALMARMRTISEL